MSDTIRLNRFIANAGVCSRREADVLISTGAITVNGKIVTELGTKVKPGDTILYGGQKLVNEKKVYVLLNKPKDYITTSDDPQERKTVMELVNAGRERIYPVGRLDRNTTGLLLLTNDGELTKRLTHPSHKVKKLYHVHLDKKVSKPDMEKIAAGTKLDDGLVIPDQLAYAGKEGQKNEVGIELHSGQNRVVRRIFEHYGYQVLKLDRVSIAGLTKKDLPRGKWRFLSEKEISFLKML
jgi:23S rRNA pseudouridine2605 synthase